MSMMTKAIVLGMALCAGAAFAETEPTDPAAIARENLMKSFAAPTMDPADKTSPDVWKNWDDFLAKGKALGDAAASLDLASAETIGAGMGAIGGSCKDCHTLYRLK